MQIVASVKLNEIYLRNIEDPDEDDQLITDLILKKNYIQLFCAFVYV